MQQAQLAWCVLERFVGVSKGKVSHFDENFIKKRGNGAMVDLLRVRDGSLDMFIQEYCEMRNILIDRDAFGVAFSGSNIYTVEHAGELIEQFADLYCLRMVVVDGDIF